VILFDGGFYSAMHSFDDSDGLLDQTISGLIRFFRLELMDKAVIIL